jgi:hypothetical protein
MAAKRARVSATTGIARGFPPGPPPPPPPADYPNKRSTGPFSAPREATAIDWAVLNGGGTGHWIRVTVFRCPVGALKVPIAGPTQLFLPSRIVTNLTVTLIGERRSVYYDVLFEDEDLNMHPSVQLFKKYPTHVIAGTLIPAGDLTQTQT